MIRYLGARNGFGRCSRGSHDARISNGVEGRLPGTCVLISRDAQLESLLRELGMALVGL